MNFKREYSTEEREYYAVILEEAVEKNTMKYELQCRRIYDNIHRIYGEKARKIEQLNLDYLGGKIDGCKYLQGFELGLSESGMGIALMEFMRDYAEDFLVVY